jgi:hypothetical protein
MDARVQCLGSRSRFLTRRKQKNEITNKQTAIVIEAEKEGARQPKKEKSRNGERSRALAAVENLRNI